MGGPTLIREVEAEFGEPFEDVIRGFADMGLGIDTTAATLGYDKRNFRRLLQRRGWDIPWPALKDQMIMRDRLPFSNETRAKLRLLALERERIKREKRAAKPVPQPKAARPPAANHPWRDNKTTLTS